VKTHIRRFREARGWTQEQLAESVGVTRQTILFLEKGKYNPSLRLAHRIAQAFSRTIEEVFTFEDEQQSD
jgi:putative transcriptional regulator